MQGVYAGRWRRSAAHRGRMRSMPCDAVAALRCCTGWRLRVKRANLNGPGIALSPARGLSPAPRAPVYGGIAAWRARSRPTSIQDPICDVSAPAAMHRLAIRRHHSSSMRPSPTARTSRRGAGGRPWPPWRCHRRRIGHRSGHGEGHSACQDAAVASTDDFLAVVGTVAYITSGCAHDPGIFGCPKVLRLYTGNHGR
jgi:hypothetical protein